MPGKKQEQTRRSKDGPVALRDDEVARVSGGYNPKEISIDKAVPWQPRRSG